MSDFAAAWALSRKRLLDCVDPLDEKQLNWRLHENSLTIGEMALHVAGVEVSFISQLLEIPVDGMHARLKEAATEGVVNDNHFPFQENEITPELVKECMELAYVMVEPVIREAKPEVREKEIKSALGPMIKGEGAFARLAFHSGYHQGQAFLIMEAPGFPK
jgi:hypothetical protein